MSDTTTLAKTWPTGDELDRIRTALDDAVNELDEIGDRAQGCREMAAEIRAAGDALAWTNR